MNRVAFHKTVGDILFLIVMTFVVAFPAPSVFKAIAITFFWLYTVFISIAFRKKTRNLLQHIWWILFFALCHLSKSWCAYPLAVEEVITNVQWCLMVSLAIVNYIVIYELSVKDVSKRLLIVTVLFIIDVILNGSYRGDRFTVIIGGYEINENVFGQIASGMCCYLLYWSKKNHWKSLLMNGSAITLLILALISGSRKSLISIVICILLLVFYEHPPKNSVKFVGRIAVIVAVLGVAYWSIMNIEMLYSSIGVRVESLVNFFEGDVKADGSANTRVLMMERAIDMFLQKPFRGYGLNAFKYVTRFGAYAHNNYLELLADLGILGLCIYYVPLLAYFCRAFVQWTKGAKDSILPLTVLLIFIINDFANVSYFSMVQHAFLALAIGLHINIRSKTQKLEADNVMKAEI